MLLDTDAHQYQALSTDSTIFTFLRNFTISIHDPDGMAAMIMGGNC
jgi:hypothetical protein